MGMGINIQGLERFGSLQVNVGLAPYKSMLTFGGGGGGPTLLAGVQLAKKSQSSADKSAEGHIPRPILS